MKKGRMREAKLSIDKIVGRNIRNKRTYRQLSREEMAELIDLTVSHLGLIERGERGATLVVLSKIAKLFDVPMGDFLIENNKEENKSNTEESSIDAARKKYEIMSTQLTEAELVFATHVIQEIVVLRNSK